MFIGIKFASNSDGWLCVLLQCDGNECFWITGLDQGNRVKGLSLQVAAEVVVSALQE